MMVKPFRLMPGPRGLPLIGSALDYSRFGSHSFEKLYLAKQENFKIYGHIYKERLGPGVTIVQVFGPEDVARILRADGKLPQRPAIPITIVANKRDKLTLGLGSLNGEGWYDLRGPAQKLLMRPRAATEYLPIQCRVADDFLTLLHSSLSSDREVPDFFQTILKYAMESIGAVCFNTRLGCLEQDLSPDSLAGGMLQATTDMFTAVQQTTFAFPWYALLRTKLYRQFVVGKKQCESVAERFIKFRETENTSEDEDIGSNFVTKLSSQKGLSRNKVLGLTSDLFTAGIDSTANALSFLVYNLARNPIKQDLLKQEIYSVLPLGTEITAESLDKMRYLKACLKESFRLNFPIEGGTTRILTTDIELGGYLVPRGTLVALNNQTMCLQEKYFERAGEFIPERWLKSEENPNKKLPKFVMLPFGHGVRMCLGRRFAEQEIYLAIIKIIQKFEVAYKHDDIEMINRVFTTLDRPLRIQFTARRPDILKKVMQ